MAEVKILKYDLVAQPRPARLDGTTDSIRLASLGLGVAPDGSLALNVVGDSTFNGNVNSSRFLQVVNASTGTAAQANINIKSSDTAFLTATYYGSNFSTSGLLTAKQGALLSSGVGGLLVGTFASSPDTAGDVLLVQGGVAASNQRINVTSSGVVFNENAQNVDLRAEGAGRPNLLVIDADAGSDGYGRVGINRAAG
jgi:hypothetical protein